MTECVQNVYVPPAPVPVLGIENASYPLVASYSHSKSIRSDSLFLIGKAVPFDPNLWIGSATSAYENVSITSGSLYLLGSIVVQPIGTEEMNFLPALREIHWRVHSFGSVRSHDVAAPIPRCDAHSLVPPPPTPLLCADMQMLVSWDNGSEAMFQLSAMPALYLGKM